MSRYIDKDALLHKMQERHGELANIFGNYDYYARGFSEAIKLIEKAPAVTDVHEEYNINWCGKIINTKPKIKNGKPIFAVIGSRGRIELNTTDMQRVEKCAKLLTAPKGRQAITSDTAHIYIIEEKFNFIP